MQYRGYTYGKQFLLWKPRFVLCRYLGPFPKPLKPYLEAHTLPLFQGAYFLR